MARTPYVLLVLALLTAGCADDEDGDSDTDSSATATATASGTISASASVSISGTGSPSNQTHSVKILDNRYDNDDITIKRGDSVNWTHEGQAPHSVTSDVGLFDSGATCSSATTDTCMKNGDHFEFEFDAVGTFTYKCRVHPTTMTGTITVTN